MSVHVAILLPRYIDLVLSGRKTVESRLTQSARAPFERVTAGDRIFFKASCGPFRATAVAGEVVFERGLSPTDVKRLKRQWNARVCGDEPFWEDKRNSRFATFITLTQVEPIDAGPRIEPSRGPAWFVLDEETAATAPAVFDLPLTDGAIRNRYVRISDRIHRFDDACYGGPTAAEAGRPIELLLPDGRCVQTDVVGNGMIRWRGWGAHFKEAGASPGDAVRFVQVGRRRFRVRFVANGR